MNRRTAQRLLAVASGAVAIAVGNAAIASAHHCYKENWTEAAYQNLVDSNTAWISLSDMGKMFILTPEQAEVCGFVVDDAVSDWMDDNGLTQEPLIHSKATIGGGAFYKKGKMPGNIRYLSEEQFGELGMLVFEGLIENDCPMPAEGDGEGV